MEQSADMKLIFYDTKLEHLTDQILALERSLIESSSSVLFQITIMNKATIIFFSDGDRGAHDHHVECALKHGVGLQPPNKGVEC